MAAVHVLGPPYLIPLGSNQECRIGYKHSHNRVSQCLASIRKLGNRRSSEGLRSFKPSKGTNLFILIILAGDIEMNPGPRFQCGLCKKYCKASDRLLECEECEKRFHASCSNLGDDELLRIESGDGAWYCTNCKADCVTKWIKSCLLPCFGSFKMPFLMFISVLVFRPEGQIWNPVRRDTKIYVRRILNASRISKTQLNSSTISPS